jgi:mRNA interferase RelE/StbE
MEIRWDEKAIAELDKLENLLSRRIVKKVKELEKGLSSSDIIRLQSSAEFRLRVGDYRIIFMIEGNIITILKIGHRKNIYDKK